MQTKSNIINTTWAFKEKMNYLIQEGNKRLQICHGEVQEL